MSYLPIRTNVDAKVPISKIPAPSLPCHHGTVHFNIRTLRFVGSEDRISVVRRAGVDPQSVLLRLRILDDLRAEARTVDGTSALPVMRGAIE